MIYFMGSDGMAYHWTAKGSELSTFIMIYLSSYMAALYGILMA
jgi:hypothetical protein